jgi:mitochondrial distribution and morphology protein 12
MLNTYCCKSFEFQRQPTLFVCRKWQALLFATMSIDLDWGKLDASFASSFIDAFNRQLESIPRPSFIGPIEVTSFDFGSQPPDIELVDMRDIYPDFLDDDDEDEDDQDEEGGNDDNLNPAERGAAVRSATSSEPLLARREGPDQDRDCNRDEDDDNDEFEWVSRRGARRGLAMEEAAPMYYHHLPPHIRYARGPASDVFTLAHPAAHPPSPHSPATSSSPALFGSGSVVGGNANVVWDGNAEEEGMRGVPGAEAAATATATHSKNATTRISSSTVPSWSSSFSGARQTHSPTRSPAAPSSSSSPPSPFSPHRDLADTTVDPPPPPAPPLPTQTTAHDEPPAVEHPNLQLHLFVTWHSDLRLTLTTSLRINYPSPLFMSLPIKLSVTGLVFNGEIAVAYEGGRRVHLCVLDDLDPYGPSARRSVISQGSTPSDPDGDDAHEAKRLPVGQRLLPEIFIESELGQADKHVLKNVTRIEKFIQDVFRRTIEEELVFPNFHTLVLR